MAASPDPLPRVIFLCHANACRSQMAEAFARTLGAGILEPASGGLHPLGYIPDEVALVMDEVGISINGQRSKAIEEAAHGGPADLIVDLVGGRLPSFGPIPLRRRAVPDCFGGSLTDYRRTRDTIRTEVEALIAEFERA